MSSGAGAAISTMPINSALTSSLENLMRCENYVKEIQGRMRSEALTNIGASDAPGAKPYMPSVTSELSNTLSSRLGTLADILDSILCGF